MLFTLQSRVKLIHIKNETWFFFVLFNQQTQSLFTNAMFFLFYVPFHMHVQTPVFLKWFLCFDGPYTVFILIYPHWFLLYPFKKSVGLVSFFSPMQHSHIHTVFKHYHEQDGMIEKRKFVQCHHWLVKIGEKKQDEMGKKWVVRLLTMEKAW